MSYDNLALAREFVKRILLETGGHLPENFNRKRLRGLREELTKVAPQKLQLFDRLFVKTNSNATEPGNRDQKTESPRSPRRQNNQLNGEPTQTKKRFSFKKISRWLRWLSIIAIVIVISGLAKLSISDLLGTLAQIMVLTGCIATTVAISRNQNTVTSVVSTIILIMVALGGIQAIHWADGMPENWLTSFGQTTNWLTVIGAVVFTIAAFVLIWWIATKLSNGAKAAWLLTFLLIGGILTWFITFGGNQAEIFRIHHTQQMLETGELKPIKTN